MERKRIKQGRVARISGPLVVAKELEFVKMHEVVRVGELGLVGEVMEIRGGEVFLQVYEETAGLMPGEKVEATGEPLSVELGPGLLGCIYDGIQRPLARIRDIEGDYIGRGVSLPGLDREKVWDFFPTVKTGDIVSGGDRMAEVQETAAVKHRILVPPGIKGRVKKIEAGRFKAEDTVCVLETDGGEKKLNMIQRWHVREPRPYKEKLPVKEPLITGTRVIDTFFPIAQGGTAAIPGPFGSGKTVVLHQLAKWSDADIIIYVGCGERGNEMTDVLTEFPELQDPRTGRPLMERTVLIANTSNMPVAAREASVYTGITIAEYFRDMGYKVALMADSTSRWAEAMREMSGRMEEMPGEEGYPAYLGTRIAEFYERAGRVICLGKEEREASLSVMGAVSPPGGDLSDPVVQNTLRIVKVFWSLEATLAYQRHFPAISWLRSYSLYFENIDQWLKTNAGETFPRLRGVALGLLQKESSLEEIVRLVGVEALPASDRLILDAAKMIREDFLQQHAFDPQDAYTLLGMQYRMLEVIVDYYERARELIIAGVDIEQLEKLAVRQRIARMKYLSSREYETKLSDIQRDLADEMKRLKE